MAGRARLDDVGAVGCLAGLELLACRWQYAARWSASYTSPSWPQSDARQAVKAWHSGSPTIAYWP
ncbi:hypothetical protein DVH21_28780 [Micromonospora aurantiaca]|uniref:Uncharacterized protein n=1 Tax=Micromonospora aurantiaca (nom. illeg.) TaxID=47850 RepID=A0A6N3K5D0_9ACTN|nr:hypothetical protein DVH21_28780 [Micromonospora aurantiaca]